MRNKVVTKEKMYIDIGCSSIKEVKNLGIRVGGELSSISSYSFKHPRYQIDDFEARKHVDEFIEGKRER